MSGIDGLEPSTQVPLYQVCVGACGYVLSRQALGGATAEGDYNMPSCEEVPR
jgi:hypothetical protein